ncbi:MAG TPA: tryptophan--tRNA ligase [Thermoanaerobaculia bacterium]|nr:tryptophan--tRNA ligase [Thermoanaerobaculia bacterium]
MSEPVVLSGLRPTGRVHLGNYFGAVRNWVDLQNSGKYRCFFFVADLHALTTDYADTSALAGFTRDAVLDWLAVGMDPQRATVFLQSRVPQHAELALYFSMITPLGWLERVPTYKDQIEALRSRDLATHGFLGYPVLMTADIALYRANFVPVGEDQASHLEICREIVRRFNGFYGEVFPEPKALFTPTPKVNGVDGRKMSKSYNNTIGVTEAPESVREKVMAMVTDPARVRRQDPGTPENCNLFPFHVLFSPPEEVAIVDRECRTAARGCVDCKKHLISNMNPALEPFRQKRAEILAAPGDVVRDVLHAGDQAARAVAEETMERVREAVKLSPEP